MTFAELCRDVFLLAQIDMACDGAERGRRWEEHVERFATRRMVPSAILPGGYRLLGHMPASGLSHQVDGCLGCTDATIVAEWKAYRGSIPKNELLRFVAATDDFYTALGRYTPRRPVIRVFGGIGSSSFELRTYAALHGVVVLDPMIWPAPLLAADDLPWPDAPDGGPSSGDRRVLRSLYRSMQQVLAPHDGGVHFIRRVPDVSSVHAALRLQEYWSERLWEAFDQEPGRFERHVHQTTAA